MKPSAQFAQHLEAVDPPRVDAQVFRQGWRIRTRLDVLRDTHRLNAAQWRAACEYRTAWEQVLASAYRSPTYVRVSGSRGLNGALADRLVGVADTVTRLREAEEAIGGSAALLCFWCAVEDRTWVRTARILHRNRETARDWTVSALQALAGVWARLGSGDAHDGL